MNGLQQMEDRLWDYIDGLSSPGERAAIDELLAAGGEWQQKYRELLKTHELIGGQELEMPSLRFTKNVMEEIALHHVAPSTKSYINRYIIWGIGGFFLALMLGSFIYGLTQVNWSAPGEYAPPLSRSLPQYSFLKAGWDKLFKTTYSYYLTGFMLVNTVLGLWLLDMYLRRSRATDTTLHKEA